MNRHLRHIDAAIDNSHKVALHKGLENALHVRAHPVVDRVLQNRQTICPALQTECACHGMASTSQGTRTYMSQGKQLCQ